LKELEKEALGTDVEIAQTDVSDSAVKIKTQLLEDSTDTNSVSTLDASHLMDSELGKQDQDSFTSPVKSTGSDGLDSPVSEQVNGKFEFAKNKKDSHEGLTASGTKGIKKMAKKVLGKGDVELIVDSETGSSYRPKVASR
jgi:hypothetical protein